MRFDFIEIGTSDFDSLAQEATPTTRGISVEPVRLYLDRLPKLPNLIQINAAVGDVSRTALVYYQKPRAIEKYALPDWVRGCNSMGYPHPTVCDLLKRLKIDRSLVIATKRVPVITVADIYRSHGVTEVDYFKSDCEGDDPTVIRSLVECCCVLGGWPERIEFEANTLTAPKTIVDTCDLLHRHGYDTEWNDSTVLALLR